MNRASLAEYLLMHIDRVHGKPLNAQIYQAIREAILGGQLPAAMKVPSTRELSTELGLSRNTVSYAYEQLLAEGFLVARQGSGTFVADAIAESFPARTRGRPRGARSGPELSARGARLVARAGASDVQWGAFMPGVPDVTRFPHKIWNRLQHKHWQRADAGLLTYGPAGGYLPLRQAIAEYLGTARSVHCSAEQVIITTGTHQSLDILIKLLGEVGDTAWIEDPCYWGTRSVLEATGLHTVPVPVDDAGLSLQQASAGPAPRFICVTPSHQYPLGMVMSLARRRLLLDYAATAKSWIIEDDYDSEFRYGGRPLASLQGLDRHERVLYMGTFSKTLFPGLRIGFIVVPASLVEPISIGASELYRGSQVFLQAVLADFIVEGHFASHVRRMRLLYAERLALLQAAINTHFGDTVSIVGDEAGLQLVLRLPDGTDDRAISAEARAAGVIARPLSAYYAAPRPRQRGLVLGYACVDGSRIAPAFATLAAIIRRHAAIAA